MLYLDKQIKRDSLSLITSLCTRKPTRLFNYYSLYVAKLIKML